MPSGKDTEPPIPSSSPPPIRQDGRWHRMSWDTAERLANPQTWLRTPASTVSTIIL